jgi:DNA-binding Lrp family transcriptional regulator
MVDQVDFSIYRWLSPGGAARFWAGRRVIDPRIAPGEIALKVGISESGVRSRLRHLTEGGYLRDQAVIPNPALFGNRVFVVDLFVRQSGEINRLVEDLGLVDAVMFARDILDEDERKVQVYYRAENETVASRLGGLLGRLSPKGEAGTPLPYHIPPPELSLTSTDWKVLRAVVRQPSARFARISQQANLSLKTVARSYHRLLDSKACWWTHGPGSEEFPLSLVQAELAQASDRPTVDRWIAKETSAWMPVAPDGLGRAPGGESRIVAGLVPIEGPSVLERFLRRLALVEGVTRTHRTFALGSMSYSSWFRGALDHP